MGGFPSPFDYTQDRFGAGQVGQVFGLTGIRDLVIVSRWSKDGWMFAAFHIRGLRYDGCRFARACREDFVGR